MDNPVYRKECSLIELLTYANEIFAKNLGLISFVILMTAIPVNILIYAVGKRVTPDDISGVVAYLVLLLIGVCLQSISSLSIAFIVKDVVDGIRPSASSVLRRAVGRWPYFFMTGILLAMYLLSPLAVLAVLFWILVVSKPALLVALLIGLGFLVLLLAWLVLVTKYSVLWTFALEAAALGNRANHDALEYSKAIVRGRWWAVFGIIFLVGLISGGVNSALGMPEKVFEYAVKEPTELMVLGIGYSCFKGVAVSFFYVFNYVFYINFDANKQQRIDNRV
jgi:hypothetical protein